MSHRLEAQSENRRVWFGQKKRRENKKKRRGRYLHVDLDDAGGATLGPAPPLDRGRSGGGRTARLFHLCGRRPNQKQKEKKRRK